MILPKKKCNLFRNKFGFRVNCFVTHSMNLVKFKRCKTTTIIDLVTKCIILMDKHLFLYLFFGYRSTLIKFLKYYLNSNKRAIYIFLENLFNHFIQVFIVQKYRSNKYFHICFLNIDKQYKVDGDEDGTLREVSISFIAPQESKTDVVEVSF